MNTFYKRLVSQEDVIRAGARSDVLIALAAASGDDSCSGAMRELDPTSSNSSSATLHQYGSTLDWIRDMNGPMHGDARDTQAGTLFHRHALGQQGHLSHRDGDIFSSGTERTVRLGSVTPNSKANPLGRNSLADGIDGPGAIAVRNDTRIGHADSKGVFAFLHIAGIDTGRCHPNANFSGERLWIGHLTDD
jgi:hypothetical protein